MAGAKRVTREDGHTYTSPAEATAACAYCGNKIVIRREGRPAKYCGPGCRSGAHRGSRPNSTTRAGMSDTQR